MPVTRIIAPSVEQFQTFARRGCPVIICGAMDSWKCRTEWTEEYLSRRLSGRKFLVTTSTSGAFGLYSSRIRDTDPYIQVTLPELLARMRHAAEDDTPVVHYMQQKTMQETFPELVGDLDWPPYLDRRTIRDANLWLSQRRSNIPLHFDTFDNLLAQVWGAKSITLYAPQQSPLLYPGREGADFASQVDVNQPDLEKYPLFRDASPDASVVLNEGEMLYLPAFWWHHVVTETRISLSINYWYHLVYGCPRQPLMAVRDMWSLGVYYLTNLPAAQRSLATLWSRQRLDAVAVATAEERLA